MSNYQTIHSYSRQTKQAGSTERRDPLAFMASLNKFRQATRMGIKSWRIPTAVPQLAMAKISAPSHLRGLLLPALLALTATPPTHAITLINNLYEQSTDVILPSYIDNDSSWYAQTFRTDSSNTVLTLLAASLRNTSSVLGSFAYDIYDASGPAGGPGNFIVNAFAGNAESLSSIFAPVVASNLSISLLPDSTYYFVVRGTSLSGSLEWAYTEATSFIGYPTAWSFSVDQGLNWSSPDLSYPQQIQVEATPQPVNIETVLIDNLMKTTTEEIVPAFITNDSWYGQTFRTTNDDSTVRSVSVRMNNPTGATGNYQYAIYDTTEFQGTPGKEIALIWEADASMIGDQYVDIGPDNLSLNLSPSTSYYLIVRGQSLSSTLFWGYTASTDFTGFPTDWSVSTTAGEDWALPDPTYPQQLRITASRRPQPIPSPLPALGLIAALRQSRRLRRRYKPQQPSR